MGSKHGHRGADLSRWVGVWHQREKDGSEVGPGLVLARVGPGSLWEARDERNSLTWKLRSIRKLVSKSSSSSPKGLMSCSAT